MLVIKDFKGRGYCVLEIRAAYTILECMSTRDRVTIPNNYKAMNIGF